MRRCANGSGDDSRPRDGGSIASFQPELIFLQDDGALALVTVVHLPHLVEIIEPADDVGSAEAFADMDLLTVQLLDETVVDLLQRYE